MHDDDDDDDADAMAEAIDAAMERMPEEEYDDTAADAAQAEAFDAVMDSLPDFAFTQGQTDAANAKRFIDRYHSELLYVPPWKKYLTWDGSRWFDDCGVGSLQRAERYSASLWPHIELIARNVPKEQLAKAVSFIKGTNGENKIKSFLKLASVDERIVCPVNELNSDPTLLNVANGTIDLTTGELRPHNPADRITQLANVVYDPTATCPRWLETLSLIFDGKQDVIRYVQQLLGYSISGDTGEHLLPIAWGKGNNGKSTIWNPIVDILGDYAILAHDELLLGTKGNHPTEKADLYQKRFVAISEPEHGSKLREARVKELTGDRTITARGMRENFWRFQRTHTFWLSTNHLPRIDGRDDGIWRRVKLLPFTVNIADKVKPIPDFDKWLVKHEGPGILAWLVRGHLDYRENGLVEPDCVKIATAAYRDDSDPLGDFLDEFCVVEADAVATAKELFKVYSETHKGQWSQAAFGRAMAERFQKHRPTSGHYRFKTVYVGVRLRPEIREEAANSEF